MVRRPAWLVLLLWFVSGVSMAQAIDCQRSGLSHSGSTICASTALRALDAAVSQRYALVAADDDAGRSQRAWLQLRDRCNGNSSCLTAIYRNRSAYLSTISPPSAPVGIADLLQPRLMPTSTPVTPPGSVTSPAEDPSVQLNRAAGPLPVVKKAPGLRPLWFLGGILLAEVLLWKMLTNFCGRCPHCHHWFTRIELDRVSQTDSGVVLPMLRRRQPGSRLHADNAGNQKFARSQTIGVRRHNQCTMCLHEWETISREAR